MFSFLFSISRWSASEFPELPSVIDLDPGPELDHALVAGGLALVLSRCSPRAAERDFRASSQAYRRLRDQVRRGGSVDLSPQLLSDVCHEVAQCADAATRQALLRCLRRGSATAQEIQAAARAVLPAQKVSTACAASGKRMGIRATAK